MYGFFIWFLSLILLQKLLSVLNLNHIYFSHQITSHANIEVTNLVLSSIPLLTIVLFVFFKLYFKENFINSLKRAFMFNLILVFFYFGKCMVLFLDLGTGK